MCFHVLPHLGFTSSCTTFLKKIISVAPPRESAKGALCTEKIVREKKRITQWESNLLASSLRDVLPYCSATTISKTELVMLDSEKSRKTKVDNQS